MKTLMKALEVEMFVEKFTSKKLLIKCPQVEIENIKFYSVQDLKNIVPFMREMETEVTSYMIFD